MSGPLFIPTRTKRGVLERVRLKGRGVLYPSTAVRLVGADGKVPLPLLLNGRPYLANSDGQLFVGIEAVRQPDHRMALVFQAWFVMPGGVFPRFRLPQRDEYAEPDTLEDASFSRPLVRDYD